MPKAHAARRSLAALRTLALAYSGAKEAPPPPPADLRRERRFAPLPLLPRVRAGEAGRGSLITL
jgi:hypothetical protein